MGASNHRLTARRRRFGRLSRGIRIGWRSGFDSGQSLDHVYGDEARGTTPLGRLIDRIYLNSPGWKGIRTRKVNIERLLEPPVERHVQAVLKAGRRDAGIGCQEPGP